MTKRKTVTSFSGIAREKTNSNYDAAIQLAASIAQGLTEIHSKKYFNPLTKTFSINELEMGWTTTIQKYTVARDSSKKKQVISKQQNDKTEVLKGSAKGAKGDRIGGKLEGAVLNGEYSINETI